MEHFTAGSWKYISEQNRQLFMPLWAWILERETVNNREREKL